MNYRSCYSIPSCIFSHIFIMRQSFYVVTRPRNVTFNVPIPCANVQPVREVTKAFMSLMSTAPAGAGNFSLDHRVQACSGAHPAFESNGYRGLSPRGKAVGVWCLPLTSIYCGQRDNFTFLPLNCRRSVTKLTWTFYLVRDPQHIRTSQLSDLQFCFLPRGSELVCRLMVQRSFT
jgi:hypothetical protein